jgi:hypothetical protein
VYLGGSNREIHAIESYDSRETLANAPELEKWSWRSHWGDSILPRRQRLGGIRGIENLVLVVGNLRH